MLRIHLALAASVLVISCGGRVDPSELVDGTEGSSSVDQGAPTSSAPPDGGAPTSSAPPDGGATVPTSDAGSALPSLPEATGICAPLSGRVATPTETVFRSQLIGRWKLCTTTSVFGTVEDGLEIAADGRWYKLYADGAGGLKRGSGFDHEGRWTIIDTSAMNGPGSFQLNLDIDGSGTVLTHPQFSQAPRGMRLNNTGVWIGDYVATR